MLFARNNRSLDIHFSVNVVLLKRIFLRKLHFCSLSYKHLCLSSKDLNSA